MARLFYRIVQHNPPTADDFISNEAIGKPPRDREVTDPELHRGISAYGRKDDAIATQRRFPVLGGFLAELALPDDDPEITLRSTSRHGSHYTIWGVPEAFVRRVQSVLPCEPDGG